MAEPQPDAIPFPEVLADFRQDPRSLLWRIPGVWPVNKPSGPSSNLVVVRARKALGLKRIGHAGTLDPMASGLLLLLAGNATRLFDHTQEFLKSYRAGFLLGERTDSQDATGLPLPDWIPSHHPPLPRSGVETALAAFRGEILQIPPMYSALKKDGQPLYKMARRGETIERQARPVTIAELRLTDFDGGAGILEMTVSKGCYVRTLIDDLGKDLGCGAVMTSLERTAIGPFTLAEAVAPEGLAERGSRGMDTLSSKTSIP